MKPSAFALFGLGLLFEICAFVVDRADHIPFVLSILASGYVAAQAGLGTLELEKSLSSEDKGFQELSELFKNELVERNPDEPIAFFLSVDRMERGNAILGFNQTRARERIPIKFFLSNGQEISWDLFELEERLEKNKSTRLFRAAVVIFLVGVVIQIKGFMLQTGAKSEPKGAA